MKNCYDCPKYDSSCDECFDLNNYVDDFPQYDDWDYYQDTPNYYHHFPNES